MRSYARNSFFLTAPAATAATGFLMLLMAPTGSRGCLLAATVPTQRSRLTDGDQTALRKGVHGARVKVDVFVDLVSPDSAAAWPALKQTAEDYGHETDFAIHVFPMPYNDHAFEAAKAVQVVRLLSGGKSQDVECFMDLAFDQQELISNAATEDMTRLEVREILGEWATSSSSMSVHQFNSAMEDPAIAGRAKEEFENGCFRGASSTPTVLVDDVYEMVLTEDTDAENLRNVLETGLLSGMYEGMDESAGSNFVSVEDGGERLDVGSIAEESEGNDKFAGDLLIDSWPTKRTGESMQPVSIDESSSEVKLVAAVHSNSLGFDDDASSFISSAAADEEQAKADTEEDEAYWGFGEGSTTSGAKFYAAVRPAVSYVYNVQRAFRAFRVPDEDGEKLGPADEHRGRASGRTAVL